MGESNRGGKPTLLTRTVKTVGRLLGPTTPTGKAFVFVEKRVTDVFDRLGRNDTYLDVVGRAMNESFRSRARTVSYQENWLRFLRLPTSTEVDELRQDVRRLHDQMEALSNQLEILVESVDKQQTAPKNTKDEAP